MNGTPVIDRETVEMLREMDEVTEDNLMLELIDDFLTHSALLVREIEKCALQDLVAKLASESHSLKGASLNIGALVLFKVCDRIEILARNHQLDEAKTEIPHLLIAFQDTNCALNELRRRIVQGEAIDDLLSEDLVTLEH